MRRSTTPKKEIRVILENIGEIDPAISREYRCRWLPGFGKGFGRNEPRRGHPDYSRLQTPRSRRRRFPTGFEMEIHRQAQTTPKFMVCNADEGDPGAFMNRKVLEGDPHSVIEGMAIGAYAVGANQGYVY